MQRRRLRGHRQTRCDGLFCRRFACSRPSGRPWSWCISFTPALTTVAQQFVLLKLCFQSSESRPPAAVSEALPLSLPYPSSTWVYLSVCLFQACVCQWGTIVALASSSLSTTTIVVVNWFVPIFYSRLVHVRPAPPSSAKSQLLPVPCGETPGDGAQSCLVSLCSRYALISSALSHGSTELLFHRFSFTLACCLSLTPPYSGSLHSCFAFSYTLTLPPVACFFIRFLSRTR